MLIFNILMIVNLVKNVLLLQIYKQLVKFTLMVTSMLNKLLQRPMKSVILGMQRLHLLILPTPRNYFSNIYISRMMQTKYSTLTVLQQLLGMVQVWQFNWYWLNLQLKPIFRLICWLTMLDNWETWLVVQAQELHNNLLLKFYHQLLVKVTLHNNLATMVWPCCSVLLIY